MAAPTKKCCIWMSVRNYCLLNKFGLLVGAICTPTAHAGGLAGQRVAYAIPYHSLHYTALGQTVYICLYTYTLMAESVVYIQRNYQTIANTVYMLKRINGILEL